MALKKGSMHAKHDFSKPSDQVLIPDPSYRLMQQLAQTACAEPVFYGLDLNQKEDLSGNLDKIRPKQG